MPSWLGNIANSQCFIAFTLHAMDKHKYNLSKWDRDRLDKNTDFSLNTILNIWLKVIVLLKNSGHNI